MDKHYNILQDIWLPGNTPSQSECQKASILVLLLSSAKAPEATEKERQEGPRSGPVLPAQGRDYRVFKTGGDIENEYRDKAPSSAPDLS